MKEVSSLVTLLSAPWEAFVIDYTWNLVFCFFRVLCVRLFILGLFSFGPYCHIFIVCFSCKMETWRFWPVVAVLCLQMGIFTRSTKHRGLCRELGDNTEESQSCYERGRKQILCCSWTLLVHSVVLRAFKSRGRKMGFCSFLLLFSSSQSVPIVLQAVDNCPAKYL